MIGIIILRYVSLAIFDADRADVVCRTFCWNQKLVIYNHVYSRVVFCLKAPWPAYMRLSAYLGMRKASGCEYALN